ncbi:MAG: FAD binding domain-containing protein, partial [Dehalococcoidia bacterium]|nr:FAD binding domain-containing protein [Dehalococcoidia bacterium]
SGLVQEKAPVISQAARRLGSVQVRNRATVGGNLCQAVPSAEMPPSLIALGTKARIYGPQGYRTIPLEDLFLGPRQTSLQRQEVLVELEVPPLPRHAGSAYLRFSPRQAMDLAIASAATAVSLEYGACVDCRIVLGAVAPVPLRATRAEDSLRGKPVEDGAIERAAELASAEAMPISDIRASAEYRREMVKVLVRRALLQSMQAIQSLQRDGAR